MNDLNYHKEHRWRKALAEIRIKSEISRLKPLPVPHVTPQQPSIRQIHKRFLFSEVAKPGLGMILLSILLTMTSIALVTSCFVTTVNSYDVALNDTERFNGDNDTQPHFYALPLQHRITAYHFQKPRFDHLYNFNHRTRERGVG